jgi:hypothetical protein
VVFNYIGILFGIFIYCLIAFSLIVYGIDESFKEPILPESQLKFSNKRIHKFCKICCLFWPIGVPLILALGVIYLALGVIYLAFAD